MDWGLKHVDWVDRPLESEPGKCSEKFVKMGTVGSGNRRGRGKQTREGEFGVEMG